MEKYENSTILSECNAVKSEWETDYTGWLKWPSWVDGSKGMWVIYCKSQKLKLPVLLRRLKNPF